jgi:hypothetical protein
MNICKISLIYVAKLLFVYGGKGFKDFIPFKGKMAVGMQMSVAM